MRNVLWAGGPTLPLSRGGRTPVASDAPPDPLAVACMRWLGRFSTTTEQFVNGETNITCNFAEKGWRYVSAGMEGHGCSAAIRMPILPV